MKRIAVAVAATGLAVGSAFAAGEWAEKVALKGDLRYRYEYIDEEGKDARQRDRIRARVGLDAQANDDVKVGVGLSSGGDKDPISSNQTLTDDFSRKDIWLELAYIDWQIAPPVALTAGKFKNCFVSVSDLIWDGDLNPEGAALRAKTGNDQYEVTGNAGYLWTAERSGEGDDTMLYVGQSALKYQFTPEVYLKVGGGYYGYDNMQGFGVLDYQAKNTSYGNTTDNRISGGVTNKVYAYEYKLVEGFSELGVWVGVPLTFFGHYVVNTEADANDTGYQAGFGVGKAKNPQTWEANYAYCEVEKDAVVGAFTDSDRFGGGTDGSGHKFNLKYQILRNLQLGATYFVNEKTISDAAKKHDYNRAQIDLVASF